MLTPQTLTDAVQADRSVLTDGAIETEIMFETDLEMDPDLGSVSLLDESVGQATLARLYTSYIDAAKRNGLPAIIGTPTFRASSTPAAAAGRPGAESVRAMNAAAVRFLQNARDESAYQPVWIAGVVGPAADAYTPSAALSPESGREYHLSQVAALAEAGVDFLFAPTFPAVGEAVGVSRAMESSGLPFVVSFVLDSAGNVLDGTPLAEAVSRVDDVAAPLYHSISCVHPTVAAQALEAVAKSSSAGRIKEVKANASDLAPSALVALREKAGDDPDTFATQMARLRYEYGVPVVGGCCGTDVHHIRALGALI